MKVLFRKYSSMCRTVFDISKNPLRNLHEEGRSSDFLHPVRQLLQRTSRDYPKMGCFGSTRRRPSRDADEWFNMPETISRKELIDNCINRRPVGTTILKRAMVGSESSRIEGHTHIRILQWNLLSQSLAIHCDKFIQCPPRALEWNVRKYLIVQELLRFHAEIMCLQEVDHFNMLNKVLKTQGYEGFFLPKPDSPCEYLDDNNGPDGCAIFFNTKLFECTEMQTSKLKVWTVTSNQVAMALNLRHKRTHDDFCVVSTHLKARQGALLTRIRDEQTRDLLNFAQRVSNGRPLIICGDFNGEPDEPFYKTMRTHQNMGLQSAYALLMKANFGTGKNKYINIANFELPYTTTKIRASGIETCTHDYIFVHPRRFGIFGMLSIPTEEEIGTNKLPSAHYPSDHLALIVDLNFSGR
ncbi:NADP/NADPH phosphatase nocturnin isoform X2 [Arctopsyche grandis]|uniref:NADP/NADPH phosphatase nocturnin isoform X2 n=1 Tax=Arctopsyche grandis TaxID=121162 RepID=UPI00406D807D